MSNYSHFLQNENTGEVYKLHGSTSDDHRNARDHRGGGGRPPSGSSIPPRSVSSAPTPRGDGHYSGGGMVRPGHHGASQGFPHGGAGGRPAPDVVAIKKSALVELIPAAGELWASFLARPDMPQAIGNDIIDRDNATLHRDALALHQQNQTRIQALTRLAARAASILVD